MSLIFHKFPSWDRADEFAQALVEKCAAGVWVCTSQREGNRYDPFPFTLTPPIVYAPRGLPDWERYAENLVTEYDGVFAGT